MIAGPDELIQRADDYARAYGRAGDEPGAGEPLDAAIDALVAARAALPANDQRAAPVAYTLGKLIMVRSLNHGGGASDRDLAIDVFTGALAAETLAPDDIQVARLCAGVLLMLRVLPSELHIAGDQMPDFAAILNATSRMGAGDTTALRADLTAAIAHLRAVTAAPSRHPALAHQGPTLLAVAQLFGGLAGMAGEEPDLETITRLLSQATDVAAPDSPGLAEVQGLHAYLAAGELTVASSVERTEQVRRQLADARDRLPADHLMRPALEKEYTIATGMLALRSGDLSLVDEVPEALGRLVDAMPADYPLRPDTVRRMIAAAIGRTAYRADPAEVDRVIELATEASRCVADADPATRGGVHYLLGMGLVLRARRDGSGDDLRAAVDNLKRALAGIPPDDELAPTVAVTLGGLLNDRNVTYGLLEDAEAAAFYLGYARRIVAAQHEAGLVDENSMRAIQGLSGLTLVVAGLRGDAGALDEGITLLREALGALPPSYLWRSRLDGALGLALILRGARTRDLADARAGFAAVEQALDQMAADHGGRPGLVALGGMAALMESILDNDPAVSERALQRLARATKMETFGGMDRATILGSMGTARVLRATQFGLPADLDAGIRDLERARDLIGVEAPGTAHGWIDAQLADALHRRGDADRDDPLRSVRYGLSALHERAGEVLLQSGAEHAVTAARQAAADAVDIARWCLAAGWRDRAVEALELGRGLVLHAATAATAIPELLREAGHAGLAEEWAATVTLPAGDWALGDSDPGRLNTALPAVAAGLMYGSAPSDARRRVLTALAGTPPMVRLMSAPDAAEIASALRSVDADALAYLLPGTGDGVVLLVTAEGEIHGVPAPELRVDPDGPIARYLAEPDRGGATWSEALSVVCDWAWPAAIEPILAHARAAGWAAEPRVVLAPSGTLGAVPWHAARTRTPDGRYRYAVQNLVVSYAASARQLVDVAQRPPLTGSHGAVFVANPLGNQPTATFEALALRRLLYPDSIGLGDTRDETDRPATPDEVLAHLPGRDAPGTALVHLSCHGLTGASPARSHLQLAEPGSVPPRPAALSVSRILRHAHGLRPDTPGPLVILSACGSDLTGSHYDEALTVATAFLSAGAVTVVGSRWEVSGRMTPPLMFMLHYHRLLRNLPPRDALRATQLWLLDPDRQYPAELPELFRGDLSSHDFTDVADWAAFSHQGR